MGVSKGEGLKRFSNANNLGKRGINGINGINVI